MRFGRDESLICLVRSDELEGCVGLIETTYWLGLPAYRSLSDGYIYAPDARYGEYMPVTADMLAELQKEGVLPAPMPTRSLGAVDYLWGYSLWWLLIVIAAFTGLRIRKWSKRVARDNATAISTDGPTIATKGDRFIEAEVKPLLREDERVTHMAYGESNGSAAGLKVDRKALAYFLVLTDQRLIAIRTGSGAIKVLLENVEVESWERADIVAVARDEDEVHLLFRDGRERKWTIRDGRPFSNQAAFLRDVPRLLDRDQSDQERSVES
jgi:hypothetical protein